MKREKTIPWTSKELIHARIKGQRYVFSYTLQRPERYGKVPGYRREIPEGYVHLPGRRSVPLRPFLYRLYEDGCPVKLPDRWRVPRLSTQE